LSPTKGPELFIIFSSKVKWMLILLGVSLESSLDWTSFDFSPLGALKSANWQTLKN
jgi:hypothetical protein